MASQYAKKKIPWLKIIVVLLLVAFVIFGLSDVAPGFGSWIMGGIGGIGVGIYMFFIGAPSVYSVVAAVALTTGILILITQRKYFFKQKILDTSAAASVGVPLQGGLIQPNAFSSAPGIGQAVIPNKDTEVTTSQ